MLKLDLHKISKHLENQKIDAQLQKETNQLVIILKIAEREFPLFIRVFDGEELLQILTFLPCTIKPNTMADTARLLHLLNKEIDLPGFGMDEAASVVFYRFMLPAKDKHIDAAIFDAVLNAAQVVCTSFAPVIAAVSYGTATFAEVVKKASEQSGGQSLAQSQLPKE